jgi:hypothetical protein
MSSNSLPSNNVVKDITLGEYLQLIWDATPKIISQRNYTVINRDKKLRIESVENWDKAVVIEELSPEEIRELQQLGVIRDAKNDTWYKLTNSDVWIKMYEAEIERKLKQREIVDQLILRERRVNDATQRLVQDLKLDCATARQMMRDHILKGNMDQIADLLGIKDLVVKG